MNITRPIIQPICRALTEGGGGSAPAPSLTDQLRTALFSNGEMGGMWDALRADALWQDTAGTTPAGVLDPVGRMDDLSGNGKHAVQAASAKRPQRIAAGLLFDGIDDKLVTPSIDLSAAQCVIAAALFEPLSTTANYPPYFTHSGLPWQANPSIAFFGRSSSGIVVATRADYMSAGKELAVVLAQQQMVAVSRRNAPALASALYGRWQGANFVATQGSIPATALPNTPVYMGHDPLNWGYNANYKLKRALIAAVASPPDATLIDLVDAWLGEVA
ncbi:MAG: hypothetical protein QM612_09095 [Thermomonas sp.]|uniref:hypothetical protein n=1 Tax=Thermomonas sp. TaxID=1971895 RepID=UPI0039E3716E